MSSAPADGEPALVVWARSWSWPGSSPPTGHVHLWTQHIPGTRNLTLVPLVPDEAMEIQYCLPDPCSASSALSKAWFRLCTCAAGQRTLKRSKEAAHTPTAFLPGSRNPGLPELQGGLGAGSEVPETGAF